MERESRHVSGREGIVIGPKVPASLGIGFRDDKQPPSPANVGQRTAALRKLRSALADASYQALRCSGAIF